MKKIIALLTLLLTSYSVNAQFSVDTVQLIEEDTTVIEIYNNKIESTSKITLYLDICKRLQILVGDNKAIRGQIVANEMIIESSKDIADQDNKIIKISEMVVLATKQSYEKFQVHEKDTVHLNQLRSDFLTAKIEHDSLVESMIEKKYIRDCQIEELQNMNFRLQTLIKAQDEVFTRLQDIVTDECSANNFSLVNNNNGDKYEIVRKKFRKTKCTKAELGILKICTSLLHAYKQI